MIRLQLGTCRTMYMTINTIAVCCCNRASTLFVKIHGTLSLEIKPPIWSLVLRHWLSYRQVNSTDTRDIKPWNKATNLKSCSETLVHTGRSYSTDTRDIKPWNKATNLKSCSETLVHTGRSYSTDTRAIKPWNKATNLKSCFETLVHTGRSNSTDTRAIKPWNNSHQSEVMFMIGCIGQTEARFTNKKSNRL